MAMVFAAPLWLFGLLPWVAVLIYCLLGQRPRQDVPFLELWQDARDLKPRHRRFAVPPAAVILGLLAALSGILAASGPAWIVKTPGAREISLVIDRGVTMSARGQHQERYKESAEAVAEQLQTRFGRQISARVVVVPPVVGEPDSRSIDLAEIREFLRSLPPTARDTSADINLAIRDQLTQGARVVVAITDGVVTGDERLVRVAPSEPPANVGIRALAARQTPTTQVMVSVHNDSSLDSAVIELRSGDRRRERSITLPAAGQTQSHFFDLPSLDALIGCRIVVNDDLPADNAAVLARSRRWPRLEVVGSVGEAVLRMIDSYQRQRPADADSTTVMIARDLPSAGDRPAVILPPIRNAASPATTPAGLIVADHPVSAHLPADALEGDLRVAASPPAGFEPVIRQGEKTLVAVRTEPRQAWVGFESDLFTARPAYVVLWTNIFTWVGGGGDTFTATTVDQIGDTWRLVESIAGEFAPRMGPGVYDRLDGSTVAVNTRPIDLRHGNAGDWRKELDAMDFRHISSRRNLGQWAVLAASGFLMLALATWPMRKGS